MEKALEKGKKDTKRIQFMKCGISNTTAPSYGKSMSENSSKENWKAASLHVVKMNTGKKPGDLVSKWVTCKKTQG